MPGRNVPRKRASTGKKQSKQALSTRIRQGDLVTAVRNPRLGVGEVAEAHWSGRYRVVFQAARGGSQRVVSRWMLRESLRLHRSMSENIGDDDP